MRARFSYTVVEPNIVVMVDDGGTRSVTNDAEAVIETLSRLFYTTPLDSFRIVYRDTDGRWDGITTHANRFAGFVMLGKWSRVAAIEIARTRKDWR